MKPRHIFSLILIILLISAFFLFRFESAPLPLFFGILGTFLMFGAEILYTFRKNKVIKFGRTKLWLQTHIIIGIVGPLFILIHSDFRFGGFAGMVLILTLIVVASGFFGRFLYRLIPKTIKGHKQSIDELKEAEIALTQQLEKSLSQSKSLQSLLKDDPVTEQVSFEALIKSSLTTFRKRLIFCRLIWLCSSVRGYKTYRHIYKLFKKRLMLDQQVIFYTSAKDFLKCWKIFHIPLTATLFIAIITHILSVFYYGKILYS